MKILSVEDVHAIEERLNAGEIVIEDVKSLILTIRELLEGKATKVGPKSKPRPAAKREPQRVEPSVGRFITAEVFTDGACEGNPGPGGWGAIVRIDGVDHELSGGEPQTTNNRMELTAAIEALKSLPHGCTGVLTTDSRYLSNGITKWITNWKHNGWRTSARKAVLNADLWRELDELNQKHDIKWQWVRGHNGHVENERCDLLAKEAIAKII